MLWGADCVLRFRRCGCTARLDCTATAGARCRPLAARDRTRIKALPAADASVVRRARPALATKEIQHREGGARARFYRDADAAVGGGRDLVLASSRAARSGPCRMNWFKLRLRLRLTAAKGWPNGGATPPAAVSIRA